ncbi:thiamine-phosphate kinase [Aestuariimicrobium ganziense]|uniref:thiamine-phosphate kinase n=1 Tax=Aestuariimicrobium ganziense TaxID=2773677 RepID=UPI0019405DB8|nr:thiamine-phosphate kinase [Aestuariimicrobium ganziense]
MSPATPTDGAETFADVGEFALISRLVRDLPAAPAVSVGPGDDAAVFLVNGSAVTSVDLLVEGVHFRSDWSSASDIGRKAVAVNVADLEAMGCEPLTMVIGLGAPASTTTQWAREFMTGVRDEAELAGITLVGGDTTAADKLVVSVTAIGQTGELAPVLRSGARPGDVVAIRGRLGWAAAGLTVLGRGFRSPRAAADAHRVPLVPYGAGRQAALAGATAMVDVSDGLLADLGHVARASEVRIDLDRARIPVDEPLRVVATAMGGSDPLRFALTGGEDHALAATFPLGRVPEDWTVVGQVLEADEDDPPVVLVDGQPWQDEAAGWQHFA